MTTLTINGSAVDDTIVINATGADSGTYSINGGPAIAFSGVTQLVVSGADGNDTLTVVNPDGSLFAPASGIGYDGGGQSGDALEVVGGSASNGNYTAGATRDAGTLTHSSGTVTQTIDFAGIAPITNTVPAATFTINGTTGHDEINIANVFLGGMSLTEVSSPTFESIRFANKATVTINGQGGDDHVMFGNNFNAMETGLTTLNLTGVGRVDGFLGWFVPNLSISASGDVIIQGSFINVAASVGGRFICLDLRPLFVSSVGGISGITANQDVVLRAPNLDIQQQINAGIGVVTLAPLESSQTISLGGADSGSVLGLTDAELDHVTASVLRIGSPSVSGGDLRLTGQITSDGHYDTLSLVTGGAIIDDTVGEQTAITVNNLALRATTGIGAGDLDVAVSNLAFDNSSSGGVFLTNATGLTIGAVDDLASSSSAGGGPIVLGSIGALTIASHITATGGINMQAIDTAAAGDDLTVLAGVTLQSSAGSVTLAAGDNLILQPGSTVQAAISSGLLVDADTADAGVGGTASPNGTVIATSINIIGDVDADVLIGTALGDLINGSEGADLMIGRAGGDTYSVTNAGDAVVENAGEGIDTVLATTHFALPPNVENLTLLLGADLQGFGNGLTNMITGNAGNNLIDGGSGADLMIGGAGNDTYFVDNAGDTVTEIPGGGNTDTVFSTVNFTLPAETETLLLQGGADLQGYGNELINTLYGNSGNNLLNGLDGADLMVGGAGNDTYFVEDPSDSAFEVVNQGNDTVFTIANYGLAANVETLVMQGSANLQGYGSNQANVIYGNAGNNLINGAGGIDLMVGGAGDDTYFVDDPSDSCFEVANEGSDAVFAFCNYGLAAEVETLVMQGSGNFQGYGNNQANTLYGNSGNNLINGAGGADIMVGGAGNDTYFVDNVGDAVVENATATEGTDAVFSTVSHTLQANVETLVLQGAGNLNGTGNDLANSIFGNGGNNVLDGGAGADVLTGNAGNDTFVFHTGEGDGDIVVDFAGNGAGAGDSLQFVGYGVGANFTNIDATHWQVNYNGGASHEVITFSNAAMIDATDFVFL